MKGFGLRRIIGVAALTLSTSMVAVLVPTTPVQAAELYPTPPDGTFTLVGRGFGHGRGMSQWGARGAAEQGLTHQQILDFYYPGTTLSTLANDWIYVWLKADNDNETRVMVPAGVSMTVWWAVPGGGLNNAPLPAGYQQWQATRVGDTMAVNGWNGSTWVPFALPTTPRVAFTSTSGVVQLLRPDGSRRDYRHSIWGVISGAGTKTVAGLLMEDYFRGVVPNEMPASWNGEALRTQAVAARSFAASQRQSNASREYHTCDDQACQVFSGTTTYPVSGPPVAGEQPTTDAAIAATAGRIVTYGGSPALAQYSSSNGGWSVSGNLPYLVARPDPFDGVFPSTANQWTASVAATTLQTVYPSIGTLLAIRVLARDGNGEWGGRVSSVSLDGTTGSVTVSGDAFRLATGLRSTWWAVYTSWQSMGGGTPSQPAAAAMGGGTVAVGIRGGDDQVWLRTQWSGWSPLGGLTRYGVGMSSRGSGALDVFVTGLDQQLYQRSFDGARWSEYVPLGGQLTSAPSAASWGPDRVDVFGRGADGAVWHRGWQGGWSGWESLGGGVVGSPAVTSRGPGLLDVAARGLDGAVWLRSFSPTTGWTPWTSLGGRTEHAPSIVALPGGGLAVYVTGTDQAVWGTTSTGGAWRFWSSLGGIGSSGPAAVIGAAGTPEVFVRGGDGAVWQRSTG